MKINTTHNGIPGDWPLWRIALDRLRELPGFGYGLQLETNWFEEKLSSKRDTSDFAFQMLELRSELEIEDGYYLQSQTIQDEESGLRKEVWQIPSAPNHETVAKMFETKLRKYAFRATHIRHKTLANDSAQLTDDQRNKMDSSARIAATRMILLRREKSISALVAKHEPQLLK